MANFDFKEALSLFCPNGQGTLTHQEAFRLLSMFFPLSEQDLLSELEGDQLSLDQLENLFQKFKNRAFDRNKLLLLLKEINANNNDFISKNTLYHVLKNSNRLTNSQYENFLNYLNLNNEQINTQELCNKLNSFYN